MEMGLLKFVQVSLPIPTLVGGRTATIPEISVDPECTFAYILVLCDGGDRVRGNLGGWVEVSAVRAGEEQGEEVPKNDGRDLYALFSLLSDLS